MCPSRLYTLAGELLTWEELHERNAEYWRTHERDGSLKPVPPQRKSLKCWREHHEKCKAGAWRGAQKCHCACHHSRGSTG